jgi:simple sugar transport system permease protein
MGVQANAAKPMGTNRRSQNFLVQFARRHGLQIGITAVALVVWLLFLIGAPRVFTSYPIYNAFMQSTPYFALMAIPLTLVVITAEIDLSFPAIMAWGVAIYVLAFDSTQNALLAFVACLAAGLLAGLLNGLIVTKVGIPSIVATLGTQFFWRGVVLVMQGGNGEGLVSSKLTLVDNLLTGRLFNLIPAQFIWTVIFAIATWFLLNRHKFGAHVYLTGDNMDSARLMGVNVDRVKTICFVIVGMAAAFAGLVQSLDVSFFWPTVGEGQLLNTLASVFLGGTSVFGGTGSIYGTFIGSYVIGAINAGIVAVGIIKFGALSIKLTGFATQLIYGLIIVISVGVQTVLSRRLRR